MDTALPRTETRGRARADASTVEIPQYSRRAIFAIWAAAALPMAAAAWLVTPLLADRFSGEGIVPMAKALYLSLTVTLVWQFVLVAFSFGASRGRFAGPSFGTPSGSGRRAARAAAVSAAGSG